MRTLVALALVLVACDHADRRAGVPRHDSAASVAPRGADLVVLRVARGGGPVRAYRFADLDSAMWTSADPAPGIDHVLAFDDDEGSLAYVGTDGLPHRVDLRLGRVTAAARVRLRSLASADGWSIYGVSERGSVVRLTPTGNWTYTPPAPARRVVAAPDGSLLVVVGRGAADALVLALRPPEATVTDSTDVAGAGAGPALLVGGRVYFAADSALSGLQARTLERVPRVHLPDAVAAIAATPSGDRIFAALVSRAEIAVVDRYRAAVTTTIPLPAPARELRMDPWGRYLLARAANGDTAWVVAVGTGAVLGAAPTVWRADLPVVAPDGSLLLASSTDVTVADARTLRPARRVPGGAADSWDLVLWNGFRPRAPGLDQPVRFAGADSTDSATTTSADSAATVTPDTARASPAPPAPAPSTAAQPGADRGWVVQFAAAVSEARAREIAAQITSRGQHPRVVSGAPGEVPVFRVVLGPFASRDEAERVGRESGRQYWIYEAAP